MIGAMRQPERGEIEEWRAEFDAAARRSLPERLRYAFIRTYKPVLDDAPYRSFETTAAYRAWCAENLPMWLGYGPAV
ncbi:MAG: hypothetical protein ACRD0X_08235 [Thermoanaerobaculia bacterium]